MPTSFGGRLSGELAVKKHQVSEPTIYAWRKHFGQLEVVEFKRLKALELENRILADQNCPRSSGGTESHRHRSC
ncbi:transposase [Roseateles sp.]|uniref:transposase n=1 Tax=Roseateles sp. TaxID=1971397 RepID=UPI003BABC22C